MKVTEFNIENILILVVPAFKRQAIHLIMMELTDRL